MQEITFDGKCPACSSGAHYKYGRTKSGKQRCICILCGRQFTLLPARKEYRNKPSCPVCGKPMHYYHKGKDSIRFRCSQYPKCRTYTKVTVAEDDR